MQTDLKNENAQGGFEGLSRVFSDEESIKMGIYTFEFSEEDIAVGVKGMNKNVEQSLHFCLIFMYLGLLFFSCCHLDFPSSLDLNHN